MASDPFEVPIALAEMIRQRLEDKAEIARLRAALEVLRTDLVASYASQEWYSLPGVGLFGSPITRASLMVDAIDAALAPQETKEE